MVGRSIAYIYIYDQAVKHRKNILWTNLYVPYNIHIYINIYLKILYGSCDTCPVDALLAMYIWEPSLKSTGRLPLFPELQIVSSETDWALGKNWASAERTARNTVLSIQGSTAHQYAKWPTKFCGLVHKTTPCVWCEWLLGRGRRQRGGREEGDFSLSLVLH